MQGVHAPATTVRRLPVLGGADRARTEIAVPPRPEDFDAVPPSIEDASGRRIRYVRLSLTDRCDLACVYCMPPGGEDDHAPSRDLLDATELARLASLLAGSGVTRLRFTGGEPLVRRDVVAIVEAVRAAAPRLALAMTTNATRLEALAAPLARAGLGAVNVSLDSLDAERFRAVTRGGELDKVVAGIHAAKRAGLDVKLNVVILGEESVAEAPRLVDFARGIGAKLRFIELMPVGEGATLPRELFVPASRVVEALGSRIDAHDRASAATTSTDHGPARYAGDVGFITAVSDEFCGDCNRMRITARGEVRPCLGSPDGASLREPMRDGASDVELAWHLHAALRTKASGHAFVDGAGATTGRAPRDAHTRVGMSLVGG